MTRGQFTFYLSFHQALSRIRWKKERCDAYDAICAYALYGAEPEPGSLGNMAEAVFALIRPTLDSAAKKAESGRQGGSKPKAKRKQSESKKEKEGEKEEEKEAEVEVEKEEESLLESAVKDARAAPARERGFVPPDAEAVAAYCAARGNRVDPRRFVAYHEANGWRVGKSPMRDWKAAVRAWERSGVDELRRPERGAAPPESEPEDVEGKLRDLQRLCEHLAGRGQDGGGASP